MERERREVRGPVVGGVAGTLAFGAPSRGVRVSERGQRHVVGGAAVPGQRGVPTRRQQGTWPQGLGERSPEQGRSREEAGAACEPGCAVPAASRFGSHGHSWGEALGQVGARRGAPRCPSWGDHLHGACSCLGAPPSQVSQLQPGTVWSPCGEVASEPGPRHESQDSRPLGPWREQS